MLDLWEDVGPPVYISVAAYLGLVKNKGKKKGSTKGNPVKGDLNELLRKFPGGMIN